jgi:hypothetical protein
MSNPNLLSAKYLECIPVIIDAPSITDGLAKAGISRSTFYRLMKNPAFHREWTGLIKERYEAVRADFLNLTDRASRAYEDCLGSQNETVKLSAAKSYYAQIEAWRELEDREKQLESDEKKGKTDIQGSPGWQYISAIVKCAILPEPFVYIPVSKLSPMTWKRIVTMDLSQDEWESLFDSVDKAHKIPIYSAALKCLLDLVSSKDPGAAAIFKKLARQIDNVVNNVFVSDTWHKLICKLASFELTDSRTALAPASTEASEPPAPGHLRRRRQ